MGSKTNIRQKQRIQILGKGKHKRKLGGVHSRNAGPRTQAGHTDRTERLERSITRNNSPLWKTGIIHKGNKEGMRTGSSAPHVAGAGARNTTWRMPADTRSIAHALQSHRAPTRSGTRLDPVETTLGTNIQFIPARLEASIRGRQNTNHITTRLSDRITRRAQDGDQHRPDQKPMAIPDGAISTKLSTQEGYDNQHSSTTRSPAPTTSDGADHPSSPGRSPRALT